MDRRRLTKWRREEKSWYWHQWSTRRPKGKSHIITNCHIDNLNDLAFRLTFVFLCIFSMKTLMRRQLTISWDLQSSLLRQPQHLLNPEIRQWETKATTLWHDKVHQAMVPIALYRKRGLSFPNVIRCFVDDAADVLPVSFLVSNRFDIIYLRHKWDLKYSLYIPCILTLSVLILPIVEVMVLELTADNEK